MIHGIGVDIVDVSRIEEVLARWGDRFLMRVFTPHEIEYCSKRTRQASRFALRFAAKEAFAKALGLGFRGGVRFQHIEVLRSGDGRPELNLHGTAKNLCREYGINRSFLSLSDDGASAVAMVVLEV